MSLNKVKTDKLVGDLQKAYGRGSSIILDDPDLLSNAPYGISTQSLAWDIAIGRPGIPAGRIIEITGTEGSGKSTLGEHLIAEVQRIGGIAVLLETEHGRDVRRMELMGVDKSSLIVMQPETMEEGFAMMEDIIIKVRKMDKKSPFMLIWDSIAATQTKNEAAIKYSDSTMGIHARLISQSLRKLLPISTRKKVTMVFINQLKQNLKAAPFQDPWVPFGGKAIEYMSSLTVRVSKKGEIKGGKKKVKTPIAFKCGIIAKKNKVGPPKQPADLVINYLSGMNLNQDLLDTALGNSLMKRVKPAGHYRLGGLEFTVDDWNEVVEKLGGTHAVRERLTRIAIRKKIIRPYEDS